MKFNPIKRVLQKHEMYQKDTPNTKLTGIHPVHPQTTSKCKCCSPKLTKNTSNVASFLDRQAISLVKLQGPVNTLTETTGS